MPPDSEQGQERHESPQRERMAEERDPSFPYGTSFPEDCNVLSHGESGGTVECEVEGGTSLHLAKETCCGERTVALEYVSDQRLG